MSFLGGAECSTAGNPLSQFTKHVQDDKSLQRDRMVSRGPNGVQGFRNNGMHGNQDHMMDAFLQQESNIPTTQKRFMLEGVRHEQQFSRAQNGSPASMSQGPGWAQDFSQGMSEQAMMEAAFNMPQGAAFSPSDLAQFQKLQSEQRVSSPIQHAPSTMNGYSNFRSAGGINMGTGMGMGLGMGMNSGMGYGAMSQSFYQSPVQQQQPQQQSDKGKGKMVELDDVHWEEQFKQIDLEGRELDEGSQAENIERELDQMDRSVESETNYGDFESIWKGIQAETAAAREMVSDDNILEDDINLHDYGEWNGFDGLNTHGYRDYPQGDYMFEPDNLMQNVSNPFDEGMQIMSEGGNLSLAALAFEAAVQKDSSHIQAWVALGQAQAQNEKETPAMRALEHALKLDPANLDALMGLAVSYTNEGYDSTAYRTLERWLSVKYPQIADPTKLSSEADIGFTDRHQLHEKVTDLFIKAAQLSPDAETMDPDVQVGLGVLFYGAEQYDKAVDCFSAALASSESGLSNDTLTVHLLWNRLGATLANSGRSEEAIAAYERALSLRSNFVRARYNLGVSCINIGCYEEAAAHLLGALSMHRISSVEGVEKAKDILGGESGPGQVSEEELQRMIHQNQSTNLYDTLRRVFTQMGRRDLAERVVAGMDVDSFRDSFEF